jgi:hypothetical protein
MTTSLDQLKAYAGSISSSSDRRMGDVRRDGWLLQLERALLANEVVKASTGRQRAMTDSSSGEDGNERRKASSPLARSETEKTSASTDYAASAHQHGGEATANQGDVKVPNGSTPGCQCISDPEGVSVQKENRNSAPMAWRFSSLENIRFGAPPYQTAVDAEITTLQTSPVKLESGTSYPLNLQERGRGDNGPESDSAEKAEEGDAGATQEVDEFQDSETYARRKLHLFRTGDGVQAWIRDPDAAEFDAHSIARALGNELTASGLKLTALTLNGKKLTHLFPDVRSDEQNADGDVVPRDGDATDHPLQSRRNLTVKGEYSNGD